MAAWCTPNDVSPLVLGDPQVSVIEDFINMASNLLYILSGRRFSGPRTVVASHQINGRGIIVLTAWQPVQNVSAVTINGVAIPFTLSAAGTYILVALQYRMQIAQITLVAGQDPPLDGQRAAAYLAADMLRSSPEYAMTEAADVKPDSRLLSIARQGVTYTYTDVTKVLDQGRTGIYLVDLFLVGSNPRNARYQPKVIIA